MTARFQMCAQKGFDAIEPDNMDGYENTTGFPITAAEQLTYDEWVATEAHSLGLAVFQKNDPEQAKTLQPYFDGVIDEQCNEFSECSSFSTYLSAGKPVLNAEYNLATTSFCAADNNAGIMGALYSLNLDGSLYTPCWSGNPGLKSTGLLQSPQPAEVAQSAGHCDSRRREPERARKATRGSEHEPRAAHPDRRAVRPARSRPLQAELHFGAVTVRRQSGARRETARQTCADPRRQTLPNPGWKQRDDQDQAVRPGAACTWQGELGSGAAGRSSRRECARRHAGESQRGSASRAGGRLAGSAQVGRWIELAQRVPPRELDRRSLVNVDRAGEPIGIPSRFPHT